MNTQDEKTPDMTREARMRLAIDRKFQDMDTPGHVAAFDPDEADALGCFEEDALSYEDAVEASMDATIYD